MAEIIPLGAVHAADVPGRLREIADQIEAGHFEGTHTIVLACAYTDEEDEGEAVRVLVAGKRRDPGFMAALLGMARQWVDLSILLGADENDAAHLPPPTPLRIA